LILSLNLKVFGDSSSDNEDIESWKRFSICLES
jgi:hypothetical protein